MSDIDYDVIIIGGGPAGLTAAIYTSRDMFNTLLLEKNICGGLAALTDLIENYPGFPEGVNGMELVNRFKEQAEKFGTQIAESQEIKRIEPAEGKIRVETAEKTYSASAVIVATGTVPKKLNIPGEKEYTGKGVSYCATCDGPLYKDKDILVVGGGNAAAEEALYMTRFARKVTLLHRRNELRADKIFQERLRENEKIELLLNHIPVSINGKQLVDSITVKDNQTDQEKILKVSGVFIYIGFSTGSKFLEGVVELDDSGYVKTDQRMQTSVPGIYAAGDIRSKDVRQVATACGEAATAAVSAGNYLKGIKAR